MRNSTLRLLKAIPLLVLVLAFTGLRAQHSPSGVFDFNYTINNDVQVSATILEFDLYLLDTDPLDPFEMATVQAGVFVNPAVYNGGTITASIVSGTSQLNATQQPTSVTYTQSANIIKLAAKSPPGIGNGTIISTTAPGTRICRIRLTNSVPFGSCSHADLTFCFTTSPYPTKVSIYTGGLNTPCTLTTSNTFSLAANPSLNCPPPAIFNVTGGGSYCQGGTGLPVGLDGSENGVTYKLYQGATFLTQHTGDGSAFTFGTYTAGTYTVTATNSGGTVNMNGSAIITETPNTVVGVSIAADATTVCAGTTVMFTATPTNGGTPTYQWYVNGTPAGTGLDTYSYIPANNDVVYVQMTSSLTGCIANNPATSNSINLTVNPVGAAAVSIAADNNPSCQGYTVTFTATPTFGGASPSYQWYVNSSAVGTSSATYSYVPFAGDQVYVVMTSGDVCATGSPVTSNTITMATNTPDPVSVSISASGNGVCLGTSVTFTATPVNGGTTPSYQWYVNTVAVGTNQNTYTYSPADLDQVYVIMTSDLPCVSGNPATSNMVTMSVNSPLPVSVSISPSANPTCVGNSVTFTATPVNGGTPSYQWYVNSVAVGTDQDTYTYSPADNDQVYVVMNSSLTCVTGNLATSNTITMGVIPTGPAGVSIVADVNPICSGSTVTFTATPTNGGIPAYQWYLNNAPVGTNQNTYSYIPANQDTVYVVMTSSLPCATGNPATSNKVGMTVNLPDPVSVSISADANPVCAGSSVTLTATPVFGGTPSYQWYLNGLPAGSDQPTYSYVPANGDQIYVMMTSSLGCVTGNPATSNTVTMTVNPLIPLSASISVDANPVCEGTSVTFTASAITKAAAFYQWYLNGNPVGTGTSTYTYVPSNNDQVYVIYSESIPCTVPATSNTITMVVNAALPVSVTAAPSENPICLGNSVTLTATPVNGGTPTYQWYLNGSTVGTNQDTYTFTPANNDQVYVILTSGLSCVSGNPATSNTVTLTVNNPVTPAVTISASANPVCVGTSVTFTATPTDGGTPSYQWYLNAAPVGSNQATYTYTPANNDQVYVVMTSSLSCVTTSTATSNTETMTVNPLIPISVSISASANPVCAGTSVTFNVGPTKSPSLDSYQWYVNGIAVGTDQTSYTYTPANNDQVYVVLTSAEPCAVGSPATSNVITMTVNPVYAVSVSIAASANPVCSGTTVTYTATPTNGGTTPVYQWYVNSLPVGTNSSTFSYAPADADQVYVVLNSDFPCTLGNPATSNTVVMNVNTSIPASVSIAESANPVCAGTSVTFTATPTNGGTPSYQWYKNASPVGTDQATYTYTPANNDQVYVVMTSSISCATGNPATSGIVTMTVNPLPVPTVTGPASACINSTGNTYTTEAGKTNYLWSVSAGGVVTAGGLTTDNFVTITWNTSGAQSVSILYTDANNCSPVTPVVYNVTVNPLPVPTISGLSQVCEGSTGIVYTTEAGMSNYSWNVSAGGTITSGGTATSNTVTVTWTTVGPQSVSVNYTNTSTCTAVAPTIYPVTVNALPVPTLSGPASVCATSSGNVYTTEAGMSNYVWTVSTGGTITSGGTATSNTVTVTWNTAGARTVSVNYTNANSCTAVAPTVYNVTVNALPVPTISGPVSACAGSTGHIYSTESGMSSYNWTISAGGTITSGSGTNAITVTWNTAGAQTVSVNYTNANSCTAASATVYNVTVNPLPVPTITGPATVCASSTGNVYTTQAGMSAYTWTVSAGGTITAGGTSTSNTVTVTWNTAGPQTVSVNYTNANSCTAVSPTVYNVTVNALPVPTITGPASVCASTSGNVYSTQAGMTGYTWTVSAGGTVTAGSGTNAITVAWNTAGAQTVSVNYTNSNSCSASTPTVYNVTVNALPTPTITGNATACAGSTGNVYTTQAGMSGYTWVVSSGGVITAGTGTNAITVTWTNAGAQSVSVNYTNATSCTALTPTVYTITVNALPVPTITGTTPAGVGSTQVYTTQAGMTSYVWSVSAGGTITAGGTATSNTVTVLWNTAGAQNVCVNYTNSNGCTATTPTCYAVSVISVPPAAGPVTGTATVCQGASGVAYSVAPIPNATGYVWTLPTGATIATGANTNSITVDYSYSAVSGNIVVYGTNTYGNGAPSPNYAVTVSPAPVPTITGDNDVCESSDYYYYVTEPGMSNYVWNISPNSGTITWVPGSNQVMVFWNTPGSHWVSVSYTNPAGCSSAAPTVYNVTVAPLPSAAGTITGSSTVCAGQSGVVYTVAPIANASSYSWTIPAGATITAGASTNSIQLNFSASAANGNIQVSGVNACGTGPASPVLSVSVNPLPAAAGAISGPNSVCQGTEGVIYTTGTIANATSYNWTVPAGATIVSGAGTNAITVNFSSTAASGSVAVTGVNDCGEGAATTFTIVLYPVPETPVITLSGYTLTSSAPAGNQWFKDGEVLSGATGQTYTVTATGNYYSIVTVNGCSSDSSNNIYVLYVGVDELINIQQVLVYPNPNSGRFTLSISTASSSVFDLRIINNLGIAIFEKKNVAVNGKFEEVIDLKNIPVGVYSVILNDQNKQVTRKFIVQ